jgi:hypothetical protein
MAPVGLLLNPPKSSQSDVSYVSYESGELCKKKKQEKVNEFTGYIAEARALANPTPPTSTRMGKGLGQGSSVPHPPSSPPPGGCYQGFGKASRKRQMIGEGKGEAIKGPTNKARPRKGKGQPRTTSKGLEEEKLANEEEMNKSEASKKRLIPSSKSEPSKKRARSSGKGGAPWRQNASKVLFV